MISDRSKLVGRFNMIDNPMPSDRGPDGRLLIAAGVILIVLTVGTLFACLWSIQGFEAPISQANVNRTTK
jgi:hypothetical protein